MIEKLRECFKSSRSYVLLTIIIINIISRTYHVLRESFQQQKGIIYCHMNSFYFVTKISNAFIEVSESTSITNYNATNKNRYSGKLINSNKFI
jgi:DNA-binding transcriptional regulator YhcF (GntR family)